MKWIEEIKEYKVYNQQEQSDKELILESINKFDDVLTRENKIVHFTSSVFLINDKHNKALMVYHNIYNNWSLIGGHCDGNNDFRNVAFKELQEETGVKGARLLNNSIFSLDILPVKAHLKGTNFVSSHLHLSVTYLMKASENELLRIKADENSDVKWINLDEILDKTKSEEHMQYLYKKLIKKVKDIRI